MSAKQNIVIISGILLAVILFILRTTPEQKSAIDVLLNEGKEALSQPKLEKVEALEERANESDAKVEAYDQLSQFWEEEGNKGLSAIYAFKAAQEIETAEAWLNSGKKFSAAYTIARERNLNSNLTFYLISAAEESYNKAIELQPSNLDIQLKLAEIYTDGQGEVMKGVQLLRGIVEKDPNHIGANLTLGRFSLLSGQYDKAVDRLEVVLKNDPDNVEALIYLSNAYIATGENEKATTVLASAAEHTEDNKLKEEILNRLEEIKN